MNARIEINFADACRIVELIQEAIPDGMDTHLFLTAIAILIEAHSHDPSGIDQQVEFLSKLSHELFFQGHLAEASQIGHA